jgi:hypothetical protein
MVKYNFFRKMSNRLMRYDNFYGLIFLIKLPAEESLDILS